jgi:hypothetical protein
MSRNLTSSDRVILTRLASSLPEGSAERKAILAGLGESSSDSYRMELFEELESFVKRLRQEPDWKTIRSKMNDALHLLGRDEPSKDIQAALEQIVAAQVALDQALTHLRKW